MSSTKQTISHTLRSSIYVPASTVVFAKSFSQFANAKFFRAQRGTLTTLKVSDILAQQRCSFGKRMFCFFGFSGLFTDRFGGEFFSLLFFALRKKDAIVNRQKGVGSRLTRQQKRRPGSCQDVDGLFWPDSTGYQPVSAGELPDQSLCSQ